jgi:hypothetical protein
MTSFTKGKKEKKNKLQQSTDRITSQGTMNGTTVARKESYVNVAAPEYLASFSLNLSVIPCTMRI